MPQPEQKSGQKICSDCKKQGVIQCKCSNDHFLCLDCSKKSIVRTKKSDFYNQYVNWCDSCIWFDIS